MKVKMAKKELITMLKVQFDDITIKHTPIKHIPDRLNLSITINSCGLKELKTRKQLLEALDLYFEQMFHYGVSV